MTLYSCNSKCFSTTKKIYELKVRSNIFQEIYLAGGETAATTLEWAMSQLLRNPKVMEKAQAEVCKVLEGKRKIEYTNIQKLDYVKLVVKETF